jgi:hypothetical protein
MNNQEPIYVDLKTDHVFPFQEFGKTWVMYYPGAEGLYCISNDFYILSLDKVIKKSDGVQYTNRRKLKKTNLRKVGNDKNKLGNSTFNLKLKGKSTSVTSLKLAKIISDKFGDNSNIDFPFKFKGKEWIGWVPDSDKTLMVSDDVFVLRLNNPGKINLDLSIDNANILKWKTTKAGCEFLQVFHCKEWKYISRNDIMKLVSSILANMED